MCDGSQFVGVGSCSGWRVWKRPSFTTACVGVLGNQRTKRVPRSGAIDCMNGLQRSVLRVFVFLARMSSRWEAVLLPRFREWGLDEIALSAGVRLA